MDKYKLFSKAYEMIHEGKYSLAAAALVHIFHEAKEDELIVKQAARLAAEIMLVDGEQNHKAVELLCFSHVKPCEWIGTMGVAAKILGQPASRVGDVVINFVTGEPQLVQSDKWCLACNAMPEEGTKECSGCGLVSYCCKEHQKSDWHLHKFVCASSTDKYTDKVLWKDTTPWESRRRDMNTLVEEALKEQAESLSKK